MTLFMKQVKHTQQSISVLHGAQAHFHQIFMISIVQSIDQIIRKIFLTVTTFNHF